MEEPISDGALNRLPSIIQKMDHVYQKVFIYLRLRKKEGEIARALGLDSEEARQKIEKVKEALIRTDQLYLVEDPRFVPIHSGGFGANVIQLRAGDLPVEHKLILSEFLSILKDIIKIIPEHQSRLLRLRYNHQLSVKDILDFSKRIDIALIPGKAVFEVKEQEVFYALNVALNAVLKRLKKRYREENSFCIENLKCIFEEIEI